MESSFSDSRSSIPVNAVDSTRPSGNDKLYRPSLMGQGQYPYLVTSLETTSALGEGSHRVDPAGKIEVVLEIVGWRSALCVVNNEWYFDFV